MMGTGCIPSFLSCFCYLPESESQPNPVFCFFKQCLANLPISIELVCTQTFQTICFLRHCYYRLLNPLREKQPRTATSQQVLPIRIRLPPKSKSPQSRWPTKWTISKMMTITSAEASLKLNLTNQVRFFFENVSWLDVTSPRKFFSNVLLRELTLAQVGAVVLSDRSINRLC